MKYDFTSIMDRMGKDAIAVEALGQNPMAPKPPKEGFDVIPMWVADMNFLQYLPFQRQLLNVQNIRRMVIFQPARSIWILSLNGMRQEMM